jgi:hypothetical protein
MNSMHTFLSTLVCSVFLFLNIAMAEEITCLPKISPSTVKLDDVPGSWTGSIRDYPLELTGVNFSDGPPSEKAFLVDSDMHEDKKSLTSKQKFYKYPSQKGKYWLICEYGEHVVFLSKEIPKEINECTVVYDKTKDSMLGYRFRSLFCK